MKDADPLQGLNLSRREALAREPLRRDPDPKALPTTGTIYSFSIVRFAAPGYAGEVPYAVGVVELDDAIRVATTLLADPLDSLRVGAPVEFQLLEVPTAAGEAVLGYAYSQVDG